MFTQERLIEAIKELPEVKLALLTMVWNVIGSDGGLDVKKLQRNYLKLEEASKETRTYSAHCKKTLARLQVLALRSESHARTG